MGNERTRDIAERGIEAFRERKQASMYGVNDRDEAMRYLMQTGYSNMPTTEGYQRFAAARGFNPQGYDINYGRGDGKYAGFQNASDLKNAVLGQASFMRDADRQGANRVSQLAQSYLDQAETQYGTAMADVRQGAQDASGYNPMQAMFRKVGGAAFGEGSGRASGFAGGLVNAVNRVPEAAYKGGVATGTADVNGWLAKTTDPYFEALDTASQIGNTDIGQYASVAGAQYGVDPALVRGWYNDSVLNNDFRQQRDRSAIDTYGMTQADLNGVYADLRRQQDQAGDDQAKAEQAQLEGWISDTTGMDANQLALKADLSMDQLSQVVGQDTFQELYSQMLDVWGDQDAMNEVLDTAKGDPMLYRVLVAMGEV